MLGDVITDKLGTFGREWGAERDDNALFRFEGKVGDPLEEGEVGVERRELVEGVEKCANVISAPSSATCMDRKVSKNI